MATNYIQAGDVIEHVAAADLDAGDFVVIGQSMGVALVDIASGATGAVQIKGVFTAPKVSAAVIAQGESVIWDASAGAFDDNAATPATGDVSGCCVAVEAAAATTTTVAVELNRGVGTVA